ncbi:unnamed protein product [Ascophyllum nodosum]
MKTKHGSPPPFKAVAPQCEKTQAKRTATTALGSNGKLAGNASRGISVESEIKVASGGKRKRSSSTKSANEMPVSSPPPPKTERTGNETAAALAVTKSSSRSSSSINSGDSGGSDKRGRTTGGEQQQQNQPPKPLVIDAAEADERSRVLMELDAEAVLSDPDVESGLKARQLLQWMMAPLPVEEFYEKCWEKNTLVVQGRGPDYFRGWLETSDLESFISTQSMQYGVDLDVTNYVNKRRITLNPAPPKTPGNVLGGNGGNGHKNPAAATSDGADGGGKVHAAGGTAAAAASGGALVTSRFVWEKFRQGCSLRMPCPQKFSDPLHRLLSALEEEFGCMVGSNVYLTPPRSQGFAPHWDDIEAFLLQVEGRKRWRVYPPAGDEAALPRLSSTNLADEQLDEPSLEVVLEPGDLLYFPRGWVHQAETVGDEHSLHITVSAMQANCWADLVEELVPQAVASAVRTNKGLRSGLPQDYLDFMGVVHSDETEDQRRERFKKRVREQLGVVVEEALEMLDAAADQMGKRYISDRLPPVLEEVEEAASVVGRGNQPITPLTRLRMARRGCARLLLEEGVAVVYHCMDNSRVHHGNALSPLQFELDDAPAIEVLLSAYPEPVRVYDLPHPPTEDLEDKVGVATALFKEGFLLVVDEEEESGNGDGHDNDDDDGREGDDGGGAGAVGSGRARVSASEAKGLGKGQDGERKEHNQQQEQEEEDEGDAF